MALAKLPSATVDGITAAPTTVEVDVSNGLPSFSIIGLTDKLVDESKERVRSAVKNTGYKFPMSRITTHLSPSEIKKSGAHFDVPIALSILLADKQIRPNSKFKESLIIGGLSLDGGLQPVRGALILAEWAKNKGLKNIILPKENADEARLVEGINIFPVENFRQIIDWLSGAIELSDYKNTDNKKPELNKEVWGQIRGQVQAKRAAIVAAAGGHSILLHGPPGAGKTMLAKAMQTLLPQLNKKEQIEVIKNHSIAGSISSSKQSLVERPLRSPHHSASHVSIVGGGNSIIRPGEISLAHRGVLFLDELPEFPRMVLESLRQPLEDKKVNVARANSKVSFPADFIMVATMNPCPCGWYESGLKECSCSAHQIERYRKKISGPILDRIDMSIQMVPVSLKELQKNADSNDEELVKSQEEIEKIWDISSKRSAGLNANLSPKEINELCQLEPNAQNLLEAATERFVITGRGFHKLLRVSRTIADLNGNQKITATDLAEALHYRFKS